MLRKHVTEISSLFHNFNDEPENINKHTFTKKDYPHKKRNTALILATTSSSSNSERSILQKKLGNKHEGNMLDKYETLINKQITQRNNELYTMNITINGKTIEVVGKVDGIIDNSILIEHKRRMRGIKNNIPFHEIVQCYMYMKMTDLKTTHLIQSFGEHIKTDIIQFDENIWTQILSRCNLLSDLFS